MAGKDAAADGKRADRNPSPAVTATRLRASRYGGQAHAIERKHDERQPCDRMHVIDVPQALEHVLGEAVRQRRKHCGHLRTRRAEDIRVGKARRQQRTRHDDRRPRMQELSEQHVWRVEVEVGRIGQDRQAAELEA
jgi:hypothetical protein